MALNDKDRLKVYLSINNNVNATNARNIIADNHVIK